MPRGRADDQTADQVEPAEVTAEGAQDDPEAAAERRRENFRRMREKAARAEALEEENLKLRTDAALRDLNLNDAQREAVLLAHKGEVDTEAYRATAASLQFVLPPDPPQTTPEEREAHRRMAEATAAAVPSEAFVRTLTDELNEASSPEQLEAILQREGLVTFD